MGNENATDSWICGAQQATLLRAHRTCYSGRTMRRPERLSIPDPELSQLALILAQGFVQRWDCYARQRRDGRYLCIHELLNVSHLFAHLRGEMTLGTYVLDQNSYTRFVVFDADDDPSWQQLGYLARDLADEGIPLMSIEQMERDLNRQLKVPSFPGSAVKGDGVGITLKSCLMETLKSLQKEFQWAK